MIWLFRSPKDGSTQPAQFAEPPAHLAPCLFPPIPVKSTSSWSFTRSLSLPSCFYSWQSPLLEFIQHVFFFSFLKSACIYWVLYARHHSRLLECFNAHNRQKSLPSWNRPLWADAFSCPIASSGNWPHPWRSSSNSCSNQGPSHGDCFFKTLTVFIFTTVHLSTKHFLIANCFMC